MNTRNNPRLDYNKLHSSGEKVEKSEESLNQSEDSANITELSNLLHNNNNRR